MSIFQFAKEIINLPRSLTGKGNVLTLKKIKNKLPKLKIKYFKSNKKVYDWNIPLEWNVINAYIKTPNGEKICDYKKNFLHLVGYSTFVNKSISKSELIKKLYSLPKYPDAIPYVTSYYKKSWGFCITHNQKKKLKNGIYKVYINSTLNKGRMHYGELYVKGKSKKEVLFSTYICHPNMANNETSGICVLTYLSKWILSKKRYYSYRIIFIPETIGSISYIEKNFKKLKKYVKFGFVITCIGDSGNYSYIPSKYGNTLSDKTALKALNKFKFKKYKWLDRGSDERQFGSPNVDLPICSITKTKYNAYKEYHTSKDALYKVVTKTGLEDGLKIYKNCIRIIEENKTPRVKIKCEMFLTKKNMYPTNSFLKKKQLTKDIINVLSYCDGENFLENLSKLCGISLKKVRKIINLLLEKKLIKYD